MAGRDYKLRVYLCHAPGDRASVRELYDRIGAEGWIEPRLDREQFLPGQDWRHEIEKAMDAADAMVVFLSQRSVSEEGFHQRRVRYALDITRQRPRTTLSVILVRLEECTLPEHLRDLQILDFFPPPRRESAYQMLLDSLSAERRTLSVSEPGDMISPRPPAKGARLPGDSTTDAPPPEGKRKKRGK